MYISSNSGSDWSLAAAPSTNWVPVSLPSSGKYTAAVAQYDGTYVTAHATSAPTPQPTRPAPLPTQAPSAATCTTLSECSSPTSSVPKQLKSVLVSTVVGSLICGCLLTVTRGKSSLILYTSIPSVLLELCSLTLDLTTGTTYVCLLFSSSLLPVQSQAIAVGLGVLILTVRVVHPGVSYPVYRGVFSASSYYREPLDKGNFCPSSALV